ncbi:MAG: IPT/TIG domain-containing protein, partial [Chloroflexi bacterium]|nr:IPT/TIG domain-containing protein [Chloroflexota bacterium]
AGGYTFKVQVKEGTDWPVWFYKYFKVTPKISASPNPGTVGQTVEIKGTGFGKDESGIAVTFDGEVRAANIHADDNGSWTTVITIPPRQSGTYVIDASGTRTRARDVPDVDFILNPGILLEPDPAYVGETITVKGGGFRPGETGIKVTFSGQVQATVAAADTNGCWETSFVLPASPYGENSVSAQGDITAPVTNTLTVKAKIEELSPTEGAPGDSIGLTGSGFGSNKKLTVTVGGVAAVSGTMQTQSNGNVVISFQVPKGVTVGKQTLKVTDEGGAAAERDFTVTKKVLPTPLPVSPNDSTIRSGIVTFNWQGITGGSDFTYTYSLEVSETPGGSAVRSKSGIEELSYTLLKEDALPRGTYYWRVKVTDNYGNESEWSEPNEFRAAPTPTWVWVVVGVVVFIALMVVAYRETKFRVTE